MIKEEEMGKTFEGLYRKLHEERKAVSDFLKIIIIIYNLMKV